jgi:hypothetical protein
MLMTLKTLPGLIGRSIEDELHENPAFPVVCLHRVRLHTNQHSPWHCPSKTTCYFCLSLGSPVRHKILCSGEILNLAQQWLPALSWMDRGLPDALKHT